MEHTILLTPNLSLFDGGAAAGAAPAGGEGAEGAAQAETTQASPGRGHRGKTGETARVVYGRQAGTTGAVEGSDAGSGQQQTEKAPQASTPEERKAAFEALVSGDYKDLFDERVQGIINRRFKEVKGLQAQAEAVRPILDMIASRYGIEDTDPAKLSKALEADDAYWEEAAQEHGMTVQQYRQFQKLQRENEAFRRAQQRQQGQQAAQQQVATWQREAQELRTDYPGFDFSAECANPQFLGMLKAGIPVKHAYEVLHLGDIKTGVAQQTAKRTERQVTETIRAKGARPSENGVAGASGIVVKSDPAKLTRADRAEIARRVARGETIQF